MIMMKQKKVHTFSILTLAINTGGLLSLPSGRFGYVEDISMFTADFIISCDKNSNFGFALVVWLSRIFTIITN